MAVQLLERQARIGSDDRRRSLLGVLRHLDVILIGATLTLAGIGLVMVYSVTRGESTFVKHQFAYVVVGVAVMALVAAVDYRHLEEWGYLLYGAAILSLLGVRAIGSESTLGAQREINLGFFSLQPSEFAVLGLIMAVAVFVRTHEEELTPRRLAKLLSLAGAPMLLVLLQPDLGTTLIMAMVLAVMLVISGVRMRHLLLLALVAAALGFIALHAHLLPSYQVQRLGSFLHQDDPRYCSGPGTCYQLIESKTAIGAGGMRGTGLFAGALTNTGFVPYAYADFIFSAVGEQLGFVGSGLVLGLFGLVSLRIFRAAQQARDSLGRLLCAGVLAFVVFSVFQNVGMSIGIMPITGIPLPFISYGGSAIVAFFAAIGLVLNVELHRGGRR